MLNATSNPEFTSPEARQLRRAIQAHRIRRLKWSDSVFHAVTDALGFGTSLRALPVYRLQQLHEIITSYRPPRADGFQYDRQGRYMHALASQAGWNETTLRQFLIIQFRKTHWNVLTKEEKQSLINTIKSITGGNV